MLPTYQNEKPASEFRVFCFTFRHLSAEAEFLICCGLVFLFYLLYGYFAELIFTFEGISGWYITLVQFLYYTIFGLAENVRRQRTVPIKIYLLLAFLTLGTMVSIRGKINETRHDRTITLFTGLIKFLIRTFKLPDANHLQKL